MPVWMRSLAHRKLVWDMPPAAEPVVYLTFDDGPHPEITPFVLEQLAKYKAKATFFCVGNNVAQYPDVYKRTLAQGHTVGNHTYDHVNGWKTDSDEYVANVDRAADVIYSNLFRPPYGRITRMQINKMMEHRPDWKLYMWSLLSGDFDLKLTPEHCLQNVLDNIRPGDIVVFHDSEKARERMEYTLPRVLEHCTQQGWTMAALPH